MKSFFLFLALLLFAGCATNVPFEPKKEDLLTNRERFALYDYARSFLFSSKKLRLTKTDRNIISSQDPKTRIHYTGHKTGVMHLYWDLPNNRQIVIKAEGYLVVLRGNKASWSVKKVLGLRGEGAYNPARYGLEK